MALINWTVQGKATMPELDALRTEEWLGNVARSHGRVMGPLTYIFCDDATILDVNRRFLQHDYFTDIITFDETLGRRISGTMYISLDTVASNAAEISHRPEQEELMRVIVHGVLHLCGINDKGPGEREIMECYENQALKLLSDAEML